MSQNGSQLNPTTAPLTNVALFCGLVERGLQRAAHLPGLLTFTGPAGYGKTTAGLYAINKHRAYYVATKDSWNRKAFLVNILRDMGITPASTINAMLDQICEQLDNSRRPLVVDEVDNIVNRSYIETVRDIHDGCQTTIILIGEEQLPGKLKRWERVHSRILDFVLAQPADINDARHLANLYCTVEIGDRLLDKIHREAFGSARRICVNLERVQAEALSLGLESIDLNDVTGLQFFTGEPPKRRD